MDKSRSYSSSKRILNIDTNASINSNDLLKYKDDVSEFGPLRIVKSPPVNKPVR